MSNKIIVVLLQSLSYDAAISRMKCMNSLVKDSSAQFFKVSSRDASLSKPYEDMMEDGNLYVNAMLNHQILKLPTQKNIFELARQHGLKTGAAAYYWISENYSSDIDGNKQDNNNYSNNEYNSLYSQQSYPDHNVFTDSEFIRKKYNPNLLLVHSMGIEYALHRFGIESQEYQDKIDEIDNTLELIIPMWLDAGYNVIVTTEERKSSHVIQKNDGKDILPLWAIGEGLTRLDLGSRITKIGITGAIYEVLDIKKPKKFINCNVN